MKRETKSALNDLVAEMRSVNDPDAKSIEELITEAGMQLNDASRLRIGRRIKKMMEEGTIEQVFKQGRTRRVKAYRDVRK